MKKLFLSLAVILLANLSYAQGFIPWEKPPYEGVSLIGPTTLPSGSDVASRGYYEERYTFVLPDSFTDWGELIIICNPDARVSYDRVSYESNYYVGNPYKFGYRVTSDEFYPYQSYGAVQFTMRFNYTGAARDSHFTILYQGISYEYTIHLRP